MNLFRGCEEVCDYRVPFSVRLSFTYVRFRRCYCWLFKFISCYFKNFVLKFDIYTQTLSGRGTCVCMFVGVDLSFSLWLAVDDDTRLISKLVATRYVNNAFNQQTHQPAADNRVSLILKLLCPSTNDAKYVMLHYLWLHITLLTSASSLRNLSTTNTSHDFLCQREIRRHTEHNIVSR